jgi:hypothetical protein
VPSGDDGPPTPHSRSSHAAKVVVPPNVYHPDGPVSLPAFGPADASQAASDALRATIAVEIREVSGLGAIPGLAETP